jgi:hypothetical protein
MTNRLTLPTPLVSTDWLAEHLGDPDLRVPDATAHPASSTLTRELLGWQPANPGLIDDLDKGHCFHTGPAPSAEPEGHRGGTS